MILRNDFIDKLLDECEDLILDKDIKGILNWVSKFYYRESKDKIDLIDFLDVVIKLLVSLISASELNSYRIILKELYVPLAAALKTPELIFDFTAVLTDCNSLLFNGMRETLHKYYTDYINPHTFDKITIKTNNFGYTIEFIFTGICDVKCKDCFVDLSDAVYEIDLRWIGTENLDIMSGINTKINIGYAKNIIYEDSCVTTVTKGNTTIDSIPEVELGLTRKLSSIVLPSIDGIQIPRWMCDINDNLLIYKEAKQKVTIFSSNKNWLQQHIKYI